MPRPKNPDLVAYRCPECGYRVEVNASLRVREIVHTTCRKAMKLESRMNPDELEALNAKINRRKGRKA